MSNKRNIILMLIIIVEIIILSIVIISKIINQRMIQESNSHIILKDDLKVSFNKDVKVSDFIDEIEGTIKEDYKIDTFELGKKNISFEYYNKSNHLIPYSFEIEVIDDTAPIIWIGRNYTINTNFTGRIEDKVMCIDDTDDEPICNIEGEYDTTKPGTYPLHYIAVDKYGNKKDWEFTLTVNNPNTKTNSSGYVQSKLNWEDVKKQYKNENTKVGIDVSGWQGDIDFDKLKEAGVEFAILRVGSKYGQGKDYFVDSKFKRNIEGFNRVEIPVGIYFYSYSNSVEESKKDAEWVLEQIKDYKVDLPIAYDWEDWGSFNKYHLSMLSLYQGAKIFLDTISNAGYKAMNYGSKNYLEAFWLDTGYPVWLAHYTKYTDYKKEYLFWQFANTGRVPGIYGDVDLDIMNLKESNNE